MPSATQNVLLLASVFLATFSGSLFWTGFPVFLNSELSGGVSLSGIYAFATAGSLAFSLIGGVLSDSRDCRKISVASQIISALLAISFGGLIDQVNASFLLFALPVFYFNLALGTISESVWFLSSPAGNGLKSRLLNRASLLIVAKISGFSLGPLVFSQSGSLGLTACATGFTIVALMQTSIIKKSEPIQSEAAGKIGTYASIQGMRDLLRTPGFVLAALLTGTLSVPMNPIFVSNILKVGAPADASMFWALAGMAGLAGMTLLRRGEIRGFRSCLLLTICMLVLVMNSFLSSVPWLIVVSGAAYVFCSTIFSMQLQIAIGEASKVGRLGARFGLLNCVMDAGIFTGMLGGSWLPMDLPVFASCLVALFLIARLFAFSSLFGSGQVAAASIDEPAGARAAP